MQKSSGAVPSWLSTHTQPTNMPGYISSQESHIKFPKTSRLESSLRTNPQTLYLLPARHDSRFGSAEYGSASGLNPEPGLTDRPTELRWRSRRNHHLTYQLA
ncbi:hypothetical protein CDAR_583191 [Caerostris darwini]|uniref:Uncharacterized protein n=1 Tax=Caerostris darwini TaxID=1538125 RepID=A0AAV4SRU6_9ARAC|nr:hypothetical protein CDAR_583191 [Caerostris darwini]